MRKDPRFKDHDYRTEEIEGHLKGAHKKLKSAYKVSEGDEESAYQLAYEAMLKASLALILRSGKRPRSQPGHHIAIIEMVDLILEKKHTDMIRVFDEMRRNRNLFLYEGDSYVSSHEVKDALEIAKDFIKVIEMKLTG